VVRSLIDSIRRYLDELRRRAWRPGQAANGRSPLAKAPNRESMSGKNKGGRETLAGVDVDHARAMNAPQVGPFSSASSLE
jgi:hypothetical protein